ncbi:MAG: hypothetical protein AAGG48_21810 [Planctomycetota bacterium]
MRSIRMQGRGMRTAKQIKARRRPRRHLLAALLVLSSPAFADQPRIGSIQVMPPLPLVRASAGGTVQKNPFCEPADATSGRPVQLASGDDGRPKKLLKPVGTAVDLQSINGNRTIHVTRPALTIDTPPTAVIRTNPLVKSTHHPNGNLVEAKTETPNESIVPTSVETSITDHEIGIIRSDTTPHAVAEPSRQAVTPEAAPVVVEPVIVEPVIVEPRGLQPIVVDRSILKGPQSNSASEPAIADEPTAVTFAGEKQQQPGATPSDEPLLFSLTDSSNSNSPDTSESNKQSEIASDLTGKQNDEPIEFRLSSNDRVEDVTADSANPGAKAAQQPKRGETAESLPVADSRENAPLATNPAVPFTITPYQNGESASAKQSDASWDTTVQLYQVTNSDTNHVQPVETNTELTKPIARLLPVPIEPMGTFEPTQVEMPTDRAESAQLIRRVESPSANIPSPVHVAASNPRIFIESKAPAAEAELERVLPSHEPIVVAETANAAPQIAMPADGSKDESQQTEAAPTFSLTDKSDAGAPVTMSLAERLGSQPKAEMETVQQPNMMSDRIVRQPVKLTPVPVASIQPESSKTDQQVVAVEVEPLQRPPMNLKPIVIDSSLSNGATRDVAESSAPDSESLADAKLEPANELPLESPTTLDQESLTPVIVDDPIQLAKVAPPKPIVVDPAKTVPTRTASASQANPAAIYRTEPLVTAPVESVASPETNGVATSQQVQGMRSPVDVQQVPAALSRTFQPATIPSGPAVQRVQALALDGSPRTVGAAPRTLTYQGPLTALPMQRGKVRSLKVGTQLMKFEVADEGTCQVLQVGVNELRLVGIQPGTTQLIVRATAGDSKQVQTRGFEIQVSDSATQFASPLTEQCNRLNRSLSQAFPTCQIKLTVQRDRLVIAGTCESNQQAREIVRMIRKACLVPVQDQLVIQ